MKQKEIAFTAIVLMGSVAFGQETGCGSSPCPQSSGLFPVPGDCTSFYNCAHCRAYKQQCAPGTAFDPLLHICNFPHLVDCSAGISEHSGDSILNQRKKPQNNTQQERPSKQGQTSVIGRSRFPPAQAHNHDHSSSEEYSPDQYHPTSVTSTHHYPAASADNRYQGQSFQQQPANYRSESGYGSVSLKQDEADGYGQNQRGSYGRHPSANYGHDQQTYYVEGQRYGSQSGQNKPTYGTAQTHGRNNQNAYEQNLPSNVENGQITDGQNLPSGQSTTSGNVQDGQTSYGNYQVNTHRQNQPGAHGQNHSGTHGQSQPGSYGQSQPTSYGQNQPGSYGQRQPTSYGQNQPSSYGQTLSPSYGKNQPSSYGQTQSPSYGKNQPSTYGQSQPTSYEHDQPIIDAKTKDQSELSQNSHRQPTAGNGHTYQSGNSQKYIPEPNSVPNTTSKENPYGQYYQPADPNSNLNETGAEVAAPLSSRFDHSHASHHPEAVPYLSTHQIVYDHSHDLHHHTEEEQNQQPTSYSANNRGTLHDPKHNGGQQNQQQNNGHQNLQQNNGYQTQQQNRESQPQKNGDTPSKQNSGNQQVHQHAEPKRQHTSQPGQQQVQQRQSQAPTDDANAFKSRIGDQPEQSSFDLKERQIPSSGYVPSYVQAKMTDEPTSSRPRNYGERIFVKTGQQDDSQPNIRNLNGETMNPDRFYQDDVGQDAPSQLTQEDLRQILRNQAETVFPPGSAPLVEYPRQADRDNSKEDEHGAKDDDDSQAKVEYKRRTPLLPSMRNSRHDSAQTSTFGQESAQQYNRQKYADSETAESRQQIIYVSAPPLPSPQALTSEPKDKEYHYFGYRFDHNPVPVPKAV